jgi:hypothetical protein
MKYEEVLEAIRRVDGNYLFPRPLPMVNVSPDEAVEIIKRYSGAELVDFFAANAPKEIPEWYNPPSKNTVPKRPQPAPEIKAVADAWARDSALYDLAVCFTDYPEKDEQLKILYPKEHHHLAVKYEEDMATYWELCEEAKHLDICDRYFSWRWHYANMMIMHRKIEG